MGNNINRWGSYDFEMLDPSLVEVTKCIQNMKEDNYTVLIDYSFNGVPETLYSGIMSKEDCEDFIEDVLELKEWVNVYKKLSTKEQLKKFINVHNIASMTVVKLVKYDEFNYGVVKE